MRFLKCLNDRFFEVRSQILLMDPLPPINRVFGLIAQQERQLSNEVIDESKVVLATRNPSGASRVVSMGKVVTLQTSVSRNMAFPLISKRVKDLLQIVCPQMVLMRRTNPLSQLHQLLISALTKEQYQSLLALLQQSQIQIAQPIAQTHSLNQISSNPTSSSNTGIHIALHLRSILIPRYWTQVQLIIQVAL